MLAAIRTTHDDVVPFMYHIYADRSFTESLEHIQEARSK